MFQSVACKVNTRCQHDKITGQTGGAIEQNLVFFSFSGVSFFLFFFFITRQGRVFHRRLQCKFPSLLRKSLLSQPSCGLLGENTSFREIISKILQRYRHISRSSTVPPNKKQVKTLNSDVSTWHRSTEASILK